MNCSRADCKSSAVHPCSWGYSDTHFTLHGLIQEKLILPLHISYAKKPSGARVGTFLPLDLWRSLRCDLLYPNTLSTPKWPAGCQRHVKPSTPIGAPPGPAEAVWGCWLLRGKLLPGRWRAALCHVPSFPLSPSRGQGSGWREQAVRLRMGRNSGAPSVPGSV